MNWVEIIFGGTRGELLGLLRRSRQQSINKLAAALGITDNAVRSHLAAMQRDGMVRAAGVERGTGGKPAQLYEMTDEAEEMFPKAYAPVLSSLIELLEERHGRDETVALLREVGARTAAAEGAGSGKAEERVQAAAEMLRRLGGDVEVLRTDGGWTIQGYGCPLSAVVADHAEVCALAESLVAGVSGMPVRECCDREGRPRCSFDLGGEATPPTSEPELSRA